MTAALLFEIVATFLFVVVILGTTGAGAPAAMAGLAIGLALVVIHLVGINVTGVSVNPADAPTARGVIPLADPEHGP